MTPERADKVMDQRLNSPRRETEARVPFDEIEARSNTLWFDAPFADCDPAWLTSWPKRRREIVREYHEPVMESLSRYGALP